VGGVLTPLSFASGSSKVHEFHSYPSIPKALQFSLYDKAMLYEFRLVTLCEALPGIIDSQWNFLVAITFVSYFLWRLWKFTLSPWLWPQYPVELPYSIPCKLISLQARTVNAVLTCSSSWYAAAQTTVTTDINPICQGIP
jgi:hypothetical protein